MRANVPNIKSAVALQLKRKLKTEVQPSEIFIQVHPIDEEDFRTETNLTKDFGLSEEEAHHVVDDGLRMLGGLNFRIAEMKTYSALSGFRDSELRCAHPFGPA